MANALTRTLDMVTLERTTNKTEFKPRKRWGGGTGRRRKGETFDCGITSQRRPSIILRTNKCQQRHCPTEVTEDPVCVAPDAVHWEEVHPVLKQSRRAGHGLYTTPRLIHLIDYNLNTPKITETNSTRHQRFVKNLSIPSPLCFRFFLGWVVGLEFGVSCPSSSEGILDRSCAKWKS